MDPTQHRFALLASACFTGRRVLVQTPRGPLYGRVDALSRAAVRIEGCAESLRLSDIDVRPDVVVQGTA